MLRRFIELISGIYTGSDMNVRMTANLQFVGMHGEGTVADDNLVWVTKTHYPMESPFGSTKFNSQKQIVIVRNPIDVFPSMAHLAMTGSQSITPNEQYNEDLPEIWDSLLKVFVPLCANQHRMIINSISKDIPTYFCRYEDLRLDAAPVLNELFSFLLDVQSIEGTVVEKRIQDVAGSGHATKAVYTLKSTSTNLSRNAHMYSEEQMEFLKKEMRDVLHYFGYTNHPAEDHETPFFTYEDQTPEDLEKFKEFKTNNAKVLAEIGQESNTKANYRFNTHGYAPFDKRDIKVCSAQLTFKD